MVKNVQIPAVQNGTEDRTVYHGKWYDTLGHDNLW